MVYFRLSSAGLALLPGNCSCHRVFRAQGRSLAFYVPGRLRARRFRGPEPALRRAACLLHGLVLSFWCMDMTRPPADWWVRTVDPASGGFILVEAADTRQIP